MAIARITVYVAEFHAVTELSDPQRFCVLDDTRGVRGVEIVTNPGNRLYQLTGDRTVRVRPGTPARIDLEFTVVTPTNCAVAGVLLNGSGFNEHGNQNNFKLDRVDANVFKLINYFRVRGTYWEMMIALEDPTSQRIGLVDPGIENEP